MTVSPFLFTDSAKHHPSPSTGYPVPSAAVVVTVVAADGVLTSALLCCWDSPKYSRTRIAAAADDCYRYHLSAGSVGRAAEIDSCPSTMKQKWPYDPSRRLHQRESTSRILPPSNVHTSPTRWQSSKPAEVR